MVEETVFRNMMHFVSTFELSTFSQVAVVEGRFQIVYYYYYYYYYYWFRKKPSRQSNWATPIV